MGKVTEDKMLRLFHKGEKVAEVPADALAEEAPIYHKPSKAAYFAEFQAMKMETPKVENYKDALFALLQQPTIASKEWVYDQYDYRFAQAQLLRQFRCCSCTCTRYRKRISNDDRL